MDNIKVLIIDDDVLFGATIVAGLQQYGMEIVYQTSLAALQEVVEKTRPNLILLDVEIGTDNSISEMKGIKSFVQDIPIIFMSGHSNLEYLMQALEEGGVSFLKKPFEIEELAAYIRRFAKSDNDVIASNVVTLGAMKLDVSTHSISFQGKEICHLTPKQFLVLNALVEKSGKIVSREYLKQVLWGEGMSSEASLDNYISQIRKICAIDPSVIINTIPKLGVIMEK